MSSLETQESLCTKEWRDDGEGKLAALNLLLMPIIAESVCNCQWWAMRVVITKG